MPRGRTDIRRAGAGKAPAPRPVRRRLADAAVALALLAGALLLAYPSLSSWHSQEGQHADVRSYAAAAEAVPTGEQQAQLELARSYNERLASGAPADPFSADEGAGGGVAEPGSLAAEYSGILDVYDGIMGYLSVPSVGIELPIRHGTGSRALRLGAGHLPQTSLPVGGEGTHSVLSAHTGLPEAKLFDDLDKVVEGDVFYIRVYGETLAYEVDGISVVEPSDTAQLARVEGEDHVTLVTCTPYGINSHRLLVRGTRVPYEAEGEVADQEYADPFPWWTLLLLAGWAAAVVALWRTGRSRVG